MMLLLRLGLMAMVRAAVPVRLDSAFQDVISVDGDARSRCPVVTPIIIIIIGVSSIDFPLVRHCSTMLTYLLVLYFVDLVSYCHVLGAILCLHKEFALPTILSSTRLSAVDLLSRIAAVEPFRPSPLSRASVVGQQSPVSHPFPYTSIFSWLACMLEETYHACYLSA